MSTNAQEQVPVAQEAQPSNKELNFRKQEAMYQKMLAEREAEIEKLRQMAQPKPSYDDEDPSEPYVDHRRLEKKFKSFEEKNAEKIREEAKREVYQAIEQERRDTWLKNNPDFTEILQNAQKLYDKDPELGETILRMPDNFERQKLVYKTIKSLGLDKPPAPELSVQDKINANRKSPYYQPSGTGAAPYTAQGDFSKDGQRRAYEKMQELKRNLRLG